MLASFYEWNQRHPFIGNFITPTLYTSILMLSVVILQPVYNALAPSIALPPAPPITRENTPYIFGVLLLFVLLGQYFNFRDRTELHTFFLPEDLSEFWLIARRIAGTLLCLAMWFYLAKHLL